MGRRKHTENKKRQKNPLENLKIETKKMKISGAIQQKEKIEKNQLTCQKTIINYNMVTVVT